MMISGLKSRISCTWRSVMPPRNGDRGEAQALGAVVRAQAAGEQAVAVGDMHLVAGARAGGADRARHQVAPGVDVLLRIADHRRLAGGARGGVDAHDLVHRHGEHAERIGVAQVGLGGERELRQVGERLQVLGFHARRVELLAVVRHFFVGVLQRPPQALELQRRAASCARPSRSAPGGTLSWREVSSFAGERRLAFLQEGGDAFAVVPALADLALQVALQVELRGEAVVRRGVNGAS